MLFCISLYCFNRGSAFTSIKHTVLKHFFFFFDHISWLCYNCHIYHWYKWTRLFFFNFKNIEGNKQLPRFCYFYVEFWPKKIMFSKINLFNLLSFSDFLYIIIRNVYWISINEIPLCNCVCGVSLIWFSSSTIILVE